MAGVPESVKEVAASETSCVLDDVFKFAGDYTITVTTQGLRGKNTDAPATATAQANEWSESVEIPLTAEMLSSNPLFFPSIQLYIRTFSQYGASKLFRKGE